MILVTGATGILGSHLLYHLLQSEERVVALYRSKEKIKKVALIFSYYTNSADIYLDKIIWKKADINNTSELEEAFEGIDEIYHCAAYVDIKNKNLNKYYEVNVQGTANIVNLALEYNIKKLVHVSSIAALGLNKEGLTTENTTVNPDEITSYYSKSKYYSEIQVWRGIEEGLNAVIVNPSVILAPYFIEGKLEKIASRIFDKGIKYYACGKKGFVDVNDVAKIMILLMKSDIQKERFILNSKNLSFKSLLNIFSKKIDKNPPSVKLNKNKLLFIKFILSILQLGKPTLNNQLIHYLINDELYSNEKIKNELNYEFTAIDESVGNLVKIYQKILNKNGSN
ncbi:MAG: SDR family NAD(P)-dependent oxidoreductase [Bacteroidales bacterium]|nr:SDR family NAD(P)-dependent oxidoreductase [Bacteroidales bacterium]